MLDYSVNIEGVKFVTRQGRHGIRDQTRAHVTVSLNYILHELYNYSTA